MKDHKDSFFKMTVKNPGLQVEINGDLDDIAHALAHAMEENGAIKEMVNHAILISMKEKIKEMTGKSLEDIEIKGFALEREENVEPEKPKEKILN